MSDEEYKKLISEKRAWYKTLGTCYCPALREEISFNAKGFHHLLYDGSGKARNRNERIRRLGLLPLIKPIIEKDLKMSVIFSKDVTYWTLKNPLYSHAHRTIVIILRRINSGNIHFYSLWDE